MGEKQSAEANAQSERELKSRIDQRVRVALGNRGCPLDGDLGRRLRTRLEEQLNGACGDGSELLESMHVEDMLFAQQCLLGDRQSIGELDRLIGEDTRFALKSASEDEIDEVLQTLRIRLLIGGDERPPGLGLYSGRGRIGGFIRTVAIRLQLNERRSRARRKRAESRASVFEQLIEGTNDPSIEHMKAHYLEEFRRALGAAWMGLSDRASLLLQHVLVDELTVDHLAQLYGVHRSTAARRLVAAREEFLRATQREIRAALGEYQVEISSVFRLIQSRIDEASTVLLAVRGAGEGDGVEKE